MTEDATVQSGTIEGHVVRLPNTDLEVIVRLENDVLTILLNKAGACVYRAVIEQATQTLEDAWLANLFTRDHRVGLGDLAAEVAEFLGEINNSQG